MLRQRAIGFGLSLFFRTTGGVKISRLVEIIDTQTLKTNKKIADVFEKPHRFYEVNPQFRIRFCRCGKFFPEAFTCKIRRQLRQTATNILDESKGFALLAMRFIGKNALKFQSDFFDAFKAMENKWAELFLNHAVIRQSSKDTNKDLMQAVHDELKTAGVIIYLQYNC